jgi:flagellar biosynthesis anti-sigma factor FlgM
VKIYPNQLQETIKAYGQSHVKVNKAANDKNEVTGKLAVEDYLSLSTKSQEVQMVKEKARQVSQIRWDKVRELRRQIAAGAYSFPSDDVAEKILTHIDKLL